MAERFAYCLFCDDVRSEIGHQQSFIGVYASQLIAPQNSILPKFCVLTALNCYHDDFPSSMTVRVKYGEVHHKFEMPATDLEKWREAVRKELEPELAEFSKEEPPKARISFLIVMSPLMLATEDRMVVHVDTERESIRAGSIKVVFRSLEPRPD